jgi:hypothetical protein
MPTMLEATHRVRLPWRYVPLLVLTTTLTACAWFGESSNHDRDYLYESDGDYVRLVPIEPGAPANSHPFNVSADQLARLLAGIKVRRATSIDEVPVFTKGELEKIAPPLAAALSKAGPNQDVTFAVASYRGILGKYSPESVTTGRLFATADSVNLIFGRIQQRKDSGELDYSEYTPPIVAGVRSHRIGDTVWKIVPGSAHFHGQRGDWLVFNRSEFPAAAAAPAAPPASEAGVKPGEATPAAPTIDSKAQAIEDRLRVLDELKKKGVITEQEYRERRREILQEL